MRCVGRRVGGSKGDTWWWDEDVKEEVSRKKSALKAIVKTVLMRIRGGIKHEEYSK